jgi:hypothetical protein
MSAKPRPERRDGARFASHRLVSVDDNIVASCGIGVGRRIGNSAACKPIRSFRNVRALLETWEREDLAHSAARRAFASLAESSFQACSLLIEKPESVSFVPPQPIRKGLDAGSGSVTVNGSLKLFHPPRRLAFVAKFPGNFPEALGKTRSDFVLCRPGRLREEPLDGLGAQNME